MWLFTSTSLFTRNDIFPTCPHFPSHETVIYSPSKFNETSHLMTFCCTSPFFSVLKFPLQTATQIMYLVWSTFPALLTLRNSGLTIPSFSNTSWNILGQRCGMIWFCGKHSVTFLLNELYNQGVRAITSHSIELEAFEVRFEGLWFLNFLTKLWSQHWVSNHRINKNKHQAQGWMEE